MTDPVKRRKLCRAAVVLLREEGRSLTELGLYEMILDRLDEQEGASQRREEPAPVAPQLFGEEEPTTKPEGRRTPAAGTTMVGVEEKPGKGSGAFHFAEAARIAQAKTRELDLEEILGKSRPSPPSEEKRTPTEPGLGKGPQKKPSR
jgi:hypothetical protein